MAAAAVAFAAEAFPSYADYMVLKDGRPFLIVNATFQNVCRLVERFALYESEFSWVFKPHTR